MSAWKHDLDYWAEQDAQADARAEQEREMEEEWRQWEERKNSGNNPVPESSAPTINPTPNPYADLF